MSWFVRVFMTVWFVGAGSLGGTIFVTALACLTLGWCRHVQNPGIGIVMGPLLVGGGLILVRAGRAEGRRDKSYLTEFLERTLEASKMTTDR
jgi:hypothetical protein